MSRYYISGPIASPDSAGNKPEPSLIESRKVRFGEVAKIITRPGREIVNPIDIKACGDEYLFCDGWRGGEHNWSCYLRYDIRELVMCNYIVMLEGWHRSPGALAELKIALMLEICPLFWEDSTNWWTPFGGPVGLEAKKTYMKMLEQQ